MLARSQLVGYVAGMQERDQMSEQQPPSDQGQRPDAGVPPPGTQPSSIQPQPQFSPDGRWWWNGQQWVPAPASPPVGAAPKSKIAAGLLAILLGDFGIHKFYLGQVGLGIVYLLFFWTLIPGIIGIVEGIIYLTMSD